MDLTISGRNVDITDRFRSYAEEKADRVPTLAPRALALEVRMCRHHDKAGVTNGGDRAELTLVGPGPVVRAEADGSDKYVAFDAALSKLMERLRRQRDKRKVHRGNHRPASLAEVAGDGFSRLDVTPASADTLRRVATGSIPVIEQGADEEEWSPVVIREKVFAAESMTKEEAVDRMELVGHAFFLFIDAATDRPSVVYRRKGWAYGVIGLDAVASPAAEQPRSRRGRTAAGR
ncbi:MAG: ribosome-associated translation inhibitor RaiA [Microbacterium sp.]|nr:ribosome-associated translation inhibitor RaiA [Microbacterium sp.]